MEKFKRIPVFDILIGSKEKEYMRDIRKT